MRPRSLPLRLRLFLDLCAGATAPLEAAVRRMGNGTVRPHDAHPGQGGVSHNLLNPAVEDLLLRLAWSGAIAMAHAAPPAGVTARYDYYQAAPHQYVPERRCAGALRT